MKKAIARFVRQFFFTCVPTQGQCDLSLTAVEGFGMLYTKLGELVASYLGPTETPKPEWNEENDDFPRIIYSQEQMRAWAEFQAILKELDSFVPPRQPSFQSTKKN